MLIDPNDPARCLRTEELAERWGTTPGHLSNLRSMGAGPPYLKIGHSVRYRLGDIQEYEKGIMVYPLIKNDL